MKRGSKLRLSRHGEPAITPIADMMGLRYWLACMKLLLFVPPMWALLPL